VAGRNAGGTSAAAYSDGKHQKQDITMATHMADLILSNSNDTLFRGWGKAISDRFTAFGWVKTADTGQIDWTTVLAPTTTNQARGYEIWRMADTLQATAPVFLKIWYGSSAWIHTGPAIWIMLGTGSDGTGNLTGQVGTQIHQAFYAEASSTVGYRCIFSGDTSRFNMCLGINRDDNHYYLWLSIERSKDVSGADTAEGVIRMGQAFNGAHQQFLPMSGPIPPNESNLGCMGPQQGTGVTGSDVILYPIFPFNADMKNPVRGAAGYFNPDPAGWS
jgi:hypothetical protein